MVSLSKSLDSTGVQTFVQVLNTGLYLAIAELLAVSGRWLVSLAA